MRKLNGRSQGKQCRMPVESKGFVLGSWRGVNDESACLVEDFQPTRCELEVLARHYLGEAREIDFRWAFFRQVRSSEVAVRIFADLRLDTIEKALGEERFQEAIADTQEEWNKRLAEANEFARNPKPWWWHSGLKEKPISKES